MTALSRPVIPTGVRPSALGWSNGAEEPAFGRWRHERELEDTRPHLKFAAVVSTFLLVIAWTAYTREVFASESEAQKQLNDLTTSLANGSVTSIDILHMPDRIETRASVTPENLERWSDCRITISRVSEWAGRNELVGAMKSTNVTPNSRMPDLRSAIIFNDPHGNRIGALYFGRYFGRYIGQFGGAEGSTGSTPVKFNGGLATWLKHMIPSSLQ